MVKDWCVLCCDLTGGEGIKCRFYRCQAASSQGPWHFQGSRERLQGAGWGRGLWLCWGRRLGEPAGSFPRCPAAPAAGLGRRGAAAVRPPGSTDGLCASSGGLSRSPSPPRSFLQPAAVSTIGRDRVKGARQRPARLHSPRGRGHRAPLSLGLSGAPVSRPLARPSRGMLSAAWAP